MRFHFEALVVRSQTLGVVMFFHIDDFFGPDDDINGHVVVAPVFQDHQTPVNAAENQRSVKVRIE